ncbi:MAG: hypothetical protein WA117_01970 [Verrucomicrobiia bacterium]
MTEDVLKFTEGLKRAAPFPKPPETPASPITPEDFREEMFREPLPERFIEPKKLCNPFRLSTESKKGIIALWRVWREDRGYMRAWDCWRRMLRNEKALKRSLDNEWEKLKGKPNTIEHRGNRTTLNEREWRLWCRKQRFLRRFAKRYGIPPTDPLRNARNVTEDAETLVQKTIQDWVPGKWQQPVWAVEDEADWDWMKTILYPPRCTNGYRLLVVIDLHSALSAIHATVEKLVKARTARTSRKRFRRAQPKEHLFEAYARAWYLHFKMRWGWTDIARKLFCHPKKVIYAVGDHVMEDKEKQRDQMKTLADKARKYALCGKCLVEGDTSLIMDEQTPGVHPEREKREQQKMIAEFLRKRRKQGVGKTRV